MVMLAISCFALTYRVVFVLICVKSGTPDRSQTTTIPLANPPPFTLTSRVVDRAPLSGATDVMFTLAAVFANCAAFGAAVVAVDGSPPVQASNDANAARTTTRT